MAEIRARIHEIEAELVVVNSAIARFRGRGKHSRECQGHFANRTKLVEELNELRADLADLKGEATDVRNTGAGGWVWEHACYSALTVFLDPEDETEAGMRSAARLAMRFADIFVEERELHIRGGKRASH